MLAEKMAWQLFDQLLLALSNLNPNGLAAGNGQMRSKAEASGFNILLKTGLAMIVRGAIKLAILITLISACQIARSQETLCYSSPTLAQYCGPYILGEWRYDGHGQHVIHGEPRPPYTDPNDVIQASQNSCLQYPYTLSAVESTYTLEDHIALIRTVVATSSNASCNTTDPVGGVRGFMLVEGDRTIYCPAGYENIKSPNFPLNPASKTCIRSVETTAVKPVPQSCPVDGIFFGNPISPIQGEKYQAEVDYQDRGAAPLSFARYYRKTLTLDPAGAIDLPSAVGSGWTHSQQGNLKLDATGYDVRIRLPNAPVQAFQFNFNNYQWKSNPPTPSVLQRFSWGWSFTRDTDLTTFEFDLEGKLIKQVQLNGWTLSYEYDGLGKLSKVSNQFGRFLLLTYNNAGGLASVITPDGQIISYAYDSVGRLATVTQRDGTTNQYLYENIDYPSFLTGIVDEAGNRFATFGYDALGRAILTEHAAGAGRYQIAYPPSGSGSASVTDPIGTTRSYNYSTYWTGKVTVTSGSLPSANGELDAATRTTTLGRVTSSTDFTGSTTTQTWFDGFDLPLTITKAAGTPEERVKNIAWNTVVRQPSVITEPGLKTAFVYHYLGFPLKKTVTDTVTGDAKIWQWTYNNLQLVAAATEPNSAVTSFTYDPRGNLLTATNALGHITSYTYDNSNRVTSVTASNGLVTTYVYDLRDRLLTQTIGGQTTALTYKPYGKVDTVTLPTGLVLTYSYDAAHRLTAWNNNRGESGTFILDALGNRTTEQIRDSGGAIAWSVARTISNINRLSGETEGAIQSSTLGYDANGELIRTTNGLNQSTQFGLDGLRRVKAVTDATNAVASLKYNALDGVTEATDFRGVVTGYTRNAQGNAISEASADTGIASTLYDTLGLPSQITDALGQATTINRDLLGRPTGLLFADGNTTTLRYDLTANSKGYLSEIVDRSGTTEYTRDVFGRVTLKKQTLANGSVQQVSYSYNPDGTLAGIGYPNGGGVLTHAYDSTGRLVGLSLNGNPLVTGIAWNPLGQPTAWTWAFSSPAMAASRVYDTAGRLSATEFSGYVYDAAGRISSLTQNLYQPGDADPTHGTIANANVTWTVGYNPVGRITSFDAPGNTAGFGYDANGNRSSSTRAWSGQTTNRTYNVGATSNRLTGFAQTINGASNTSVTYGYNANGDLLTDGLRGYTYDAAGRLATATTGATDVSPTTRYAHNALGQRVFKTEPLYPPVQGDESNPGFMQSLIVFFTKLWSPATTQAEQLGYAYVYDEQGTLLSEVGSGGQNSAGQAQYIYLPTANGPMPIAAVINGNTYAVHSDHLNTPRKLTNASGNAVWQWSYSAFGEDKPTLAKNRFANQETTPNPGTTGISEVKFNLRYPGQYADEESGLFYNGYRSYIPTVGRYTQGDPIGLDGGWNRFGYVSGNPLSYVDPDGLQISIPAPVLGAIARPSAGASGLGTLVDPLVGPFQPPEDPNDKDKAARCERLRLKIENLKKEVFDKRIPDLAANPGNLPYRIGPGEQLRDTVRGHEKLLNRQWRRLNELEDQQSRECPC